MAYREATIQALLCDFIRMQWPKAMFVSDSSGEFRATVGQRARAARLRSNRGYPDFFLAEPRGPFHGLYLELKVEGSKLFKVRTENEYISPHVAEQAKCLSFLSSKGYCTNFAIGLDDAIHQVRKYMAQPEFKVDLDEAPKLLFDEYKPEPIEKEAF